jgi:hypothetical protein
MKASELAVDWIRASEGEGGQTDGHDEKNSLFRSFAKATKNTKNLIKTHEKKKRVFIDGARGNLDSIISHIVNKNVTKTDSEICTSLD